jgi:hypothetical protein
MKTRKVHIGGGWFRRNKQTHINNWGSSGKISTNNDLISLQQGIQQATQKAQQAGETEVPLHFSRRIGLFLYNILMAFLSLFNISQWREYFSKKQTPIVISTGNNIVSANHIRASATTTTTNLNTSHEIPGSLVQIIPATITPYIPRRRRIEKMQSQISSNISQSHTTHDELPQQGGVNETNLTKPLLEKEEEDLKTPEVKTGIQKFLSELGKKLKSDGDIKISVSINFAQILSRIVSFFASFKSFFTFKTKNSTTQKNKWSIRKLFTRKSSKNNSKKLNFTNFEKNQESLENMLKGMTNKEIQRFLSEQRPIPKNKIPGLANELNIKPGVQRVLNEMKARQEQQKPRTFSNLEKNTIIQIPSSSFYSLNTPSKPVKISNYYSPNVIFGNAGQQRENASFVQNW